MANNFIKKFLLVDVQLKDGFNKLGMVDETF